MKSSLIQRFLGLFGWSAEQRKKQEEENQKRFDEARKREILIALVRLKDRGREIAHLLDVHEELKNIGRYMHTANIIKYCAMLKQNGFVQKIGDYEFVISDNGLNHLGLPGR